MYNSSSTNQKLIEENTLLKQRILELEKSEAKHKRTEEALRESNEILSLFINYSPIYAFIKEVTPTQSITLQASDNYRQMIGIPGCEMVGKTMEEIFLPDFAAKITKDDWTVVSGGCVLRLDEELNGRSYKTIKFPIVMGKRTLLAGYSIDTTDLKHTQEALQESEELYRAVFENTGTATIILEEDNTISLVNTEFERLFGYTKEETEHKKKWMDFIVKDDLEKMLTQHRLRTEDPEAALRSYEFRLINKAGETRDILLFVEIIKRTKQCIASLVDITERKRAEEALRESETRLRTLSDNLHGGVVYQVDSGKSGQQRQISYVSAGVEKLCGISVNEALNDVMLLYGLIIEEDRHLLVEREAFAMANMSIFSTEVRIRTLSGEIRWVLLTSVPRRLPNHHLIWDGIGIDITERKRAEEALRQSEATLQSVFNAAPVGICIMKDRVFQRANKAWHELFGYSETDIAGRTTRMLYENDEEYDRVGRQLYASLSERGLANVQTRLRRKDGAFRYDLLVAAPLQSGDLSLGTVVMIEDITERKQAEMDRLQLEERLSRAEKMEALGLLAGGVAHDLNNVLGIVTGYSELLLFGTEESSPLRPYATNIMNATKKAGAIIQDMLTLARRGVQTRKVINLNTLIRDFMKTPEFERIKAFHPRVRIETSLEATLLNIMGSPLHIEKTIVNLVSNAAEAMPEGGGLTIATRNQYMDRPVQGYDEIREGDYVAFSISDTGEGISASDIKHIFEPFYTKKAMGRSGTGLGLAVAWGTVKDHNGYIDVQSQEGKGSTFSLYFPVTREELSEEPLSVSMTEYMGKGESILVVDDIESQRELATRILETLNYRVDVVPSGEEAFEYMKDHSVDLIVLDMIMDPGMDGLDTYSKIMEIRPNQKAIIVSGYSETDRVTQAQALGAGTYVKKPYVLEKLGLAVKSELDRSI